jgi:gas vesicle protein
MLKQVWSLFLIGANWLSLKNRHNYYRVIGKPIKTTLKSSVMKSSSDTILGLLAATAAGIAIGLLIAPEKGADMRKMILDKANDLGSKAGDIISTGKDKLTEMSGKVANQAEAMANDAGWRTNNNKERVG